MGIGCGSGGATVDIMPCAIAPSTGADISS